MAGVWVIGLVVVVATLALWALLEGIHERLKAIEGRLDHMQRLLEGRGRD